MKLSGPGIFCLQVFMYEFKFFSTYGTNQPSEYFWSKLWEIGVFQRICPILSKFFVGIEVF